MHRVSHPIRGLLGERGIVIAQGITRLRKHLPVIVEDQKNELTPLSREVMRELYEQLVALDEQYDVRGILKEVKGRASPFIEVPLAELISKLRYLSTCVEAAPQC